MVTNHKRIRESLIFDAGSGEWFNQPGGFLDMGEDAEPRPASRWHVELRQAIDAQETPPQLVVIDVTRMAWLAIGPDFGFLLHLSKQLSQRGTRLAVVGLTNTINAARIGKLTESFDVYSSVDEALGKA